MLRKNCPPIVANGCGQAAVAGFKVRKFHFNCMLIRIPDDGGEPSARNSACTLLAVVGTLLPTLDKDSQLAQSTLSSSHFVFLSCVIPKSGSV